MERLRQHPELLARFQSILELTRNADGPLKTADEVEELRQVGQHQHEPVGDTGRAARERRP